MKGDQAQRMASNSPRRVSAAGINLLSHFAQSPIKAAPTSPVSGRPPSSPAEDEVRAVRWMRNFPRPQPALIKLSFIRARPDFHQRLLCFIRMAAAIETVKLHCSMTILAKTDDVHCLNNAQRVKKFAKQSAEKKSSTTELNLNVSGKLSLFLILH